MEQEEAMERKSGGQVGCGGLCGGGIVSGSDGESEKG